MGFAHTLIFLTFALMLDLGLSAKFLLSVPKAPHYDSDYTATVTAYGLSSGERKSVLLKYTGKMDRSKVLNHTSLWFDQDGVQNWTVMFPWERMQEINEQGVRLTMSSGTEEYKDLDFAQDTGYIFIQTDKPIYTPRQTVKFRIIAVDEYQQLAKYHLKVDIKNEKQVIVDRMRYTAEDAFKGQEFELPKETPPGIWTIAANFEGLQNNYGHTHAAEFEVREYVLPRFSADLEIGQEVITKETEWITAKVTAMYVYGRPVIGSAEMQLGVWDSKNGVKLFPQKYYKELVNGEFKQDIRVGNLFPDNEDFPQNKRLYVNVNVTESATLENHTIEDTSTFIAHPYYIVEFAASKQYFKPGFPYTFYAQVRAQSGTYRPAAKWVKLYVMPTFRDSNNQYIHTSDYWAMVSLDNDGKAVQVYDKIPDNAAKIEFETFVLDLAEASYERYSFHVDKYSSPNNEYMHISLETPLQKYRDGIVLLQYKKSYAYSWISNYRDEITVLVLSRGQVIYSTSTNKNSDGRSSVRIPKELYAEATPSMRVVAYYFVKNGQAEFVVDSLFVDTEDVCLEEISMFPPGGTFGITPLLKPRDKFHLEVLGSPDMRVGFVAVDKAVLLLRDEETLTRDTLFAQLGSHDQGEGSGDGKDLKEVLENSGLIYMLVESELQHNVFVPSFEHVYGMDGLPGLSDTAGLSKGPLGPMFQRPSLGIKSEIKTGSSVSIVSQVARPQTVRKYFPESWFFEERRIPKNGILDLNLTLPDSITTWSFLAVGLSSKRGVCVSHSVQQEVQKLFFVDVRLPYKVTRLEEAKVRIAVYNYQKFAIVVNVVVSSSDGLCFSANTARGSTQNSTSFYLNIAADSTTGETVKVIPLKIGDLTLRVDVQSQSERDIVEKQLHVVAEGLRVRKSITFVLDPEAKHATYMAARRRKITLSNTATVNNIFDLRNKEQQTTIDLALPREVIRGTESCGIAAFGDLMGDIITHAVVLSKNLIDQAVVDAEEVLGDLSPTVHALLYANSSGLMYDELRERGRRFVRHGISRLLKYKQGFYFTLTPESKPASWLTAFVLKTLCHASSLAFVDRRSLIDQGFYWLMDQVTENGTINEEDWRLAKDSLDYRVMLAADVFIALKECERNEDERHLELQANMIMYMEDNLEKIQQPMVLAKVTYALMLDDPKYEGFQEAAKRLNSMRRRNKLGQFYWSDEEDEEPRRKPFWYYQGVKASAIEATAYALLVSLETSDNNVDAIADWLVAQRNHNGAFIGAMDSSAAIQALSAYSLQKHGLEVDLSCNVSFDRMKEYIHSFKFTGENATRPESLSNVPVGRVLEVLTKGQGLGQMQVNVEYNVPIDKNEKCPFKIDINVTKTVIQWRPDMHSSGALGDQDNPLCTFCDIGCAKEENKTANVTTTATPNVERVRVAVSVDSAVRLPPRRKRPTSRDGKTGRRRNNRRRQNRQQQSRQTRSLSGPSVASKKSICIHICLQHQEKEPSGPTTVEIEMLTGYRPVSGDIQRMKELENVKYAEFVDHSETLVVQFTQISNTEKSCVAFRAVDEEEIGRRIPATVVVKEVGRQYPSCVLDYFPVMGEESLRVYCADFSHLNRGECRCYSGLCSSCGPIRNSDYNLHSVKQLACQQPIAYQLQMATVEDKDMWVEVNAKVVSLNKTTGFHDGLKEGDYITMMTPSSCSCPIINFDDTNEQFYMLSTDVEKLVDRRGDEVYRYLLDEKSVFLRVSGDPSSSQPAVPLFYLQQALSPNNRC